MMLPNANKTKMIQLLRDRGFDVVNSRCAQFRKYRTSFWLDYEDSSGAWHRASYSAAGYRPYLMVDSDVMSVPMEVVKRIGLYRMV